MKINKIVISFFLVTILAGTAYYVLNTQQHSDSENYLVREHSPVIGPKDAPVTLVEFIDPACEACRAMYPYVKEIINEHPQQIKLVIRYVDFHKQSKQAIQILEAARKQGKFNETLELLLAFQPFWAPHGQDGVDLWEVLQRGDLDLEKAKKDAQSPEILQVLQLDMQDLKTAGVKKTPSFFVNGKALKLMHPDVLKEMIETELKDQK